jgi:hypothetical protein
MCIELCIPCIIQGRIISTNHLERRPLLSLGLPCCCLSWGTGKHILVVVGGGRLPPFFISGGRAHHAHMLLHKKTSIIIIFTRSTLPTSTKQQEERRGCLNQPVNPPAPLSILLFCP